MVITINDGIRGTTLFRTKWWKCSDVMSPSLITSVTKEVWL